MTRDAGMEALLESDLAHLEGTEAKRMFGGMATMWRGNLLCGASDRGLLVRLGKGNDGWAVAAEGVEPAIMGGRVMQGWVRVAPEAAGDDALRQRLLRAAEAFVGTLPPK